MGLAHCLGIPALRRPSYVRSFASRRGGARRAILIRARHPAEANDVGGQDRSDFSRFAHRAPSTRRILSQKTSAGAAESRIGAPPSVYGFDVYLRAYPRRLDRRRGSQQGLLNGAGEPAGPPSNAGGEGVLEMQQFALDRDAFQP
jgi:hypothetical protein